MFRVAVALSIVCVGAIAVGVSQASAPTIKANSIAGATLGQPATTYEQLFGMPYRIEVAQGGDVRDAGFQQPEGWTRLVFPKRKIDVYFDSAIDGAEKAVLVTTWNKKYRTARGIGPCSTVKRMKRAYRKRVRPSKFNRCGPGSCACTSWA